MPFAYHGSLVSGFLKKFGEGLLTAVECFGVVGKSILMTMLSCQHTGSTGTAQRIGNKAVGESHTFFGYSVDIGRLNKTIVVCTNRLKGMVVTHNIDHVHWLFCFLWLG